MYREIWKYAHCRIISMAEAWLNASKLTGETIDVKSAPLRDKSNANGSYNFHLI